MNSIIKNFFNQIAYGNTEAPLQDPERVLGVSHLVMLISSFLND